MAKQKSFKEKVEDVVSSIPEGRVLSYKRVAELAGSPRAYRAVGNIMNRNRNPRVPCHRVIRSDGQIGGYAWGTERKEKILKEEGFAPASTSGTVLTRAFFDRPVLNVAPDLLGKFLVRRIGNRETSIMISEVEAYDGPHDKACHAYKGLTTRTAPMFGPAGRFYVYFCYGVHWMLNIVTGPKGYPAAVLIRGAGSHDGPAKLTKALKIDNALNISPAAPASGLWFEDRGVRIGKRQIKTGPRIGVGYAGPIWSKKAYRFTLSL